MTNPSPGLPHPVRRVSPASPNSAAITSSMLPIHCGESSSDRQAMRRVPPELSKPVRRVPHRPPLRERASPASPIDRHCTNAERRLPPRLHQSVRRVVPRPPSNAASFSGFPELSKPMRRVIPPGLPHPVRRVIPRKSRSSPNCAQNKNSTALTIGNEGIQIQWPSRAHTRKHEAALPPVLMFFYNFFINIILFYYWVTNRDFIDLFCHTPKT